jgi:hypothetical protein
MIDSKVISRVRNGVCAVGYLTVPLEEYKRNIQSHFFQVVGTGFLVRETTVITNRHVIDGLFKHKANLGFHSSQFFLSFVTPRESHQLQITKRMIRCFDTPANEELDVGFLEFKVVTEAHFFDISSLDIASSFDLHSSEEIAVCGYPYGTSMLKKNARVYRWGPVIQRGFISAISPFDTATEPDQILLDVRAAGGMSGAPIFRPSDGEVIGILHSRREATTAMGLPLTKQNVDAWLELYDIEQNASDRNQVGSGLPNIAST